MHSPTVASRDAVEGQSLPKRILLGIAIGVCLLFLLPEPGGDSFPDVQTIASLAAAVVVFCLLYRYWPGERP